jgi:hypothetical protein
MERRKKVGVLTFHKCINYGSYWQARCLAEGLSSRGFATELLDHDCTGVRQAEARCALNPSLPHRSRRAELRQYAAKTRKFVEAIAKLPLSASFSLHQPEAAGRYDAVVVGSDEVWNFRHPWYGSKPIFFGDRLNTERLVSYAASFGNHSAWDGIDAGWASKLDRFQALSVRDQNSWHLVQGGVGREPELVLDPCLAFPEPTRVTPLNGCRFAVVYGHGFPDWLQQRVRDWADRSGTKLISIGYVNEFADEQRLSADPVEFAGLMAGSSAVVTNFFHGCVFALANGKPWAAAPSEYRSIKIPDLAETLRSEHRLIDQDSSQPVIDDLLGTPVEPAVQRRIDELRGASLAYLEAALG